MKNKIREMTINEVTFALRNALDLDGFGLHDKFDMFLSRPIADPHLESMRKEILHVVSIEGQPIPGRDFGPRGEECLRRNLQQLERGIAPMSSGRAAQTKVK